MAAEGSAERVRGEDGDASRADAPFDLGDSRDLAAAVHAAWGDEPIVPPPRPEVPRPPLNKRARVSRGPDPVERDPDPLSHLRHGTPRRFSFRIPGPVRLPTGRPTARTIAAAGIAIAALAAAAAFPIVSGTTRRSPVVAEPRPRQLPTTSTRLAPTTAFTYPPETIVPADTTAVPPPPAAVAAESSTPVTATPNRTPTRSRTTATTRATSQTTSAPSTTTTQPPPPPPDDSGGSGDASEPPPYP